MFESVSAIFDVLGPIILSFGGKFPVIFTVIFFIGTARFFMKPIMSAISAYIESTPTKSDDAFLAKLKDSVIYKIVIYILDWCLSVKLPK